MQPKKFIIGSCAFFSDYPDFHSKDIDVLELVPENPNFKIYMHLNFGNKCVFKFVEKPKDEMIDYVLNCNTPMQVGKFLIPEFAHYYNLSIDDLKRLEPLILKLDAKHQ